MGRRNDDNLPQWARDMRSGNTPFGNNAGRVGYGIGRVPADVDPTSEALAELEAERLQPTPKPRREVMRCRRCRQVGEVGGYPFSTCPDSGLCDDCF
jgi:hypothetical protein